MAQSTDTHNVPQQESEDALRNMLRQELKKVSQREPLPPTYHGLLKNQNINASGLPKDNLYKSLSNLREKVETFVNKNGVEIDPMRKCGKFRKVLNKNDMRSAFTLRECKPFEQKSLIAASLATSLARRVPWSNVDEATRKRHIQAMSLGTREKEQKKIRLAKMHNEIISAKNKNLATEEALMRMKKSEALDKGDDKVDQPARLKDKERKESKERQSDERERMRNIKKTKERERERVESRRRLEEEAESKIEEEKRRAQEKESPQQALHRLYEPMFRRLWNMEFSNLNNTNPFRIVIDKDNCVAMGVPDYCDIIKKPMNLTYVQEKVESISYKTLKDFFEDITMLINNALLYNSDSSNEYHKAALQMKKRAKKEYKLVLEKIQQN